MKDRKLATVWSPDETRKVDITAVYPKDQARLDLIISGLFVGMGLLLPVVFRSMYNLGASNAVSDTLDVFEELGGITK